MGKVNSLSAPKIIWQPGSAQTWSGVLTVLPNVLARFMGGEQKTGGRLPITEVGTYDHVRCSQVFPLR